MKPVVFIFLILVAGCTHRPMPIVSADRPPSEAATLSLVSAAVIQARDENARGPSELATKAIASLLRVAIAGLPVPTPADLKRMRELSGHVLAGRDVEADAVVASAERELENLREQIKKEREESAEQMRRIIADAEARVKAAEDEGARKAFLILVTASAITGGLISIAGALIAWMTTYKILGAAFILVGPCVAGSALLWGKPWFYIPAGLGILLVGLALGIKLVWSILDRNGNGRLDFLERKPPVTA